MKSRFTENIYIVYYFREESTSELDWKTQKQVKQPPNRTNISNGAWVISRRRRSH